MIHLQDIRKAFNAGQANEFLALDQVTLTIESGRATVFKGPSGSGKSTLVRLINGLEPVTSGSLVVDGHPVSAMTDKQLRAVRPDIGMIFQQFNLFSTKTVAQNIAYPLRQRRIVLVDPEIDREREENRLALLDRKLRVGQFAFFEFAPCFVESARKGVEATGSEHFKEILVYR